MIMEARDRNNRELWALLLLLLLFVVLCSLEGASQRSCLLTSLSELLTLDSCVQVARRVAAQRPLEILEAPQHAAVAKARAEPEFAGLPGSWQRKFLGDLVPPEALS